MFAASAIVLLTTLAVCFGSEMTASDAFLVLQAGSTVTLAFAAVGGAAEGTIVSGETVTTLGQSEASAELLDNTVSQRITEMRPSSTPLDTIIRQNSIIVPVKSWETEYYAVDMRGVNDTLAAPVSESLVDDDLLDVVEITVTNYHIWSLDDSVMFKDVAGSDNMDLVANIVAMDAAAKTLSVVFLNPASGTIAIDPGVELVRIGNAKGENDAQTDPYAIMPQKASNYCQIHMAQVEETIYAKLHSKEVKWDIADYKMQALYDLRRSMEFTSLFGYKKRYYDATNKKEKYLSGGLTRFITKKLDYTQGGIDNAKFVDWTKSIFTGNSGSDKRFLFGGDSMIAELSKVDTISKQIEAKSTEVVYGITFNKIETNFGVLLVKHHPLMTFAGWGDKAVVLDMNNIEKHVFKPMEARELELRKPGLKNANAYVVDECFCLVLRYPDTHAIIEKATTGATGATGT